MTARAEDRIQYIATNFIGERHVMWPWEVWGYCMAFGTIEVEWFRERRLPVNGPSFRIHP